MKTIEQQLDDLLRRLHNASAGDMTDAEIEALFDEAARTIASLRSLATFHQGPELDNMKPAGRA